MLKSFNEKIIISGKYLEYYQYLTKSVLRGYKREKRSSSKIKTVEVELTQEESAQKTSFSVNRTRTEIRRLVNSNPQLNKFLTLTFGYEMIDLNKANRLFNAYIRKMSQRFSEFQYLAIIEFQKDVDYQGNLKKNGGSVHYHLLCNLRYVQNKKLEKIWKHGFVKIKRIDRVDNIGKYVCKYLQKEMDDKRMFGKKKFFRSQNLKKPIEILGGYAGFFLNKHQEKLKLVWGKKFNNEYQGEVLYRQYQL